MTRTPPRAGGTRDLVGGLFIGTAAILFGGVVILGAVATRRGLPVAPMLAVRFAIAGSLLAVVLAVSRRALRPARGEGWRLGILGAVGYAVESALFFLALGRGTAAAVTLLFFTYPVWVALLSAVLGIGLPGWLVGGSLAAAVAGAGVVVGSSGGLDITTAGVVLALLAALTFSGYLVGAEVAVRRTSPIASAMWVSLTAAGALAAAAAVLGGRLPVGAEEWVPVAAMGILTAGAFWLLFLGLRRLGAVRAAIIAALEPVATALLALGFLGERIRAGTIVGGVLILAAAITASAARGLPDTEGAVP